MLRTYLEDYFEIVRLVWNRFVSKVLLLYFVGLPIIYVCGWFSGESAFIWFLIVLVLITFLKIRSKKIYNDLEGDD